MCGVSLLYHHSGWVRPAARWSSSGGLPSAARGNWARLWILFRADISRPFAYDEFGIITVLFGLCFLRWRGHWLRRHPRERGDVALPRNPDDDWRQVLKSWRFGLTLTTRRRLRPVDRVRRDTR